MGYGQLVEGPAGMGGATNPGMGSVGGLGNGLREGSSAGYMGGGMASRPATHAGTSDSGMDPAATPVGYRGAGGGGGGGGGGSRSNLGLSSMLLAGPIPTSLAMLREQSGSVLLASLDDRNRCGSRTMQRIGPLIPIGLRSRPLLQGHVNFVSPLLLCLEDSRALLIVGRVESWRESQRAGVLRPGVPYARDKRGLISVRAS